MHNQAAALIYELFPVIWKPAPVTQGKRVGGANLSKYGTRGLIFEAAKHGGLGTIDMVEKTKLYDFFNYLAFCREINANS